MQQKPLITIVIPCYNDSQYIEQSINSAVGQSYSRKEIIVVDDGSNKQTKKVLRELRPKIHCLITQTNKGQSTARNRGIKAARGEYILMLDSDDFFEPLFCEKAIKVIEGKTDVKLITCYARRLVNEAVIDVYQPEGGKIKDFLTGNKALGTSLYRKEEAVEAGGYDEKMVKGFEDWEFFIRLLKNGGEAYVVQEPLYNYRLRDWSTSSKAKKIKYDLMKYILLKHKDLYTLHYNLLIEFLLSKIENEEKEKLKNLERIESKVGRFILYPLRKTKNVFKLRKWKTSK